MTVTPELLRQIPIFNALEKDEIVEILSCFSEAEFKAGEEVYTEGEPATNACFLVDGELEAFKSLPGGGQTKVGAILPGAILGEMALMTDGSRTATVRALKKSVVVKVSYHFFHAALVQMSVPAFKILRAIVRVMTCRLDELQARILQQWDCEPFIDSSNKHLQVADIRDIPPSFEFKPFLTTLPCFKSFDEGEIDAVLSRGEVGEVPRGEFLYAEGAAPNYCFLVLRGSVEQTIVRDRRYQLSVLGPGRLCGVNALISRQAHRSDARVISRALIVRFDQNGFDTLYQGQSTACLKYQNLISANQLAQLKAANNLLSVLDSQNQILGRPCNGSL